LDGAQFVVDGGHVGLVGGAEGVDGGGEDEDCGDGGAEDYEEEEEGWEMPAGKLGGPPVHCKSCCWLVKFRALG